MESPEPILQYFEYAHLVPELREVSKPFCDLAHRIVDGLPSHEGAGDGYDVHPLPRNPERTVALRKLLEAKDAAVRAKLAK